MALILSQNDHISLDKEISGLRTITVELAWALAGHVKGSLDVDASAFLLGVGGKVARPGDFVFYNNFRSSDGSVELLDPGREAGGSFLVDFSKVAPSAWRLVFTLTIHEVESGGHDFGLLTGGSIMVLNQKRRRREVAGYDFASANLRKSTALVCAEIRREDAEWHFLAVGQGAGGGLAGLAKKYGVAI
ncbi:MAG: TerD family protein [Deltaproteobacteria bacterium]|jgi:tellurium resistance protein TerD|nr:TerD family protein [Deltaproteobacteria bacterium]